MAFVVVWEFRVRPDRTDEFVKSYSPGGAWAKLFERGDGFLGSHLMRDESTPTRFITIDRWRDASAAWHFASLAQRVAGGENVTLADLIPRDTNSLLRHFRLPADDPGGEDFAAVLERSASALLASEGLTEAILRLAGLPVPLPKTLRAAIATLGVVERREVLRRLLRESFSPPALAQGIRFDVG